MAQVSPTLDLIPTAPASRRSVGGLLGVLYLCTSMALSFWYMKALAPSMANDFLWVDFNASIQAFLMDSISTLHALSDPNTTEISLTSLLLAQPRRYDDDQALVKCHPTYPRQLLYTKLNSLEANIESCRGVRAMNLVFLSTQHCWVDLEMRWELGHTARRQQRCRARYIENGAVYLEALLRNTDMKAFMATVGGPGGVFTIGIHRALAKSAAGAAFMQAVTTQPWLSVADEAAHWRTFNISRWQLQYQNWKQTGSADSVSIHPALGYVYDISLNVIPYNTLTYQWTTVNMYYALYNDLIMAQGVNVTLVRSDDQFADESIFQDVVAVGGTLQRAIQATLGPLNSIDLYLVPIPQALVQLVREFQRAVNTVRLTQSDAKISRIDQLWDTLPPSWTITPTIRAWNSTGDVAGFVGGSPLCAFDGSTQFLQQEWGFDDICDAPTPMAVTMQPLTVLFATAMATILNGQFDLSYYHLNVCTRAPSPADVELCQRALTTASQLLQRWMQEVEHPLDRQWIDGAVDELARGIPVQIIQFARDAQNRTMLLQQSLLDATDPVFSFVGWTFLMDWVVGVREVVSFEGDVATLHLISYQYTSFVTLRPDLNQLPRSIGRLFMYGVWYVSVVLAAVAAAVLAISMYDGLLNVSGRNLLHFYRVAGFTWVGRPLLLLRGITAIALISSSGAELVVAHGYSRLEYTSRPLWRSFVLASEATWITYVVSDVLLLFVQRQATRSATGSYLLAFAISFVLDVAVPVELNVTFGRVCKIIELDANVLCQTAVIHSGSFDRAVMLTMISVGTVLLASLATHCSRSPPHSHQDVYVLYPGAATSFFISETIDAAAPVHEWWLDNASHVMCGLIFVTVRDRQYVFDIKSWLVLRLSASNFRRTRVMSTFVRRKGRMAGPKAKTPSAAPTPSAPRVFVAMAMVYIFSTLGSSVVYLSVLQDGLTNDAWWTGFNTTGTHFFVATLAASHPFEWALTADDTFLALDQPEFSQLGIYGSPTNTEVIFSPSYAEHAKDVFFQDLPSTIHGLRNMNGCHVPWTATQYCWVDLNRQWEMATTLLRQRRCERAEVGNAAVYLEAVLRNIPVDGFLTCWGDAFEVAIASDLQSSLGGRTWLAQTFRSDSRLSETDELTKWRSVGLDRFTTQWQNYKVSGILETIEAANAFGVSYPLTLKQSNGTWRFDVETSFKMYWTWGNHLWAVGLATRNETGVAGRSLVRSSPRFAYSNVSMVSVLVQNGTLPSPLPWTAQLFQRTFGPFGSLDLKYVAVPATAMALVLDFHLFLNGVMYGNPNASKDFRVFPQSTYTTQIPLAWKDTTYMYVGGSPMCNTVGGSLNVAPFFGRMSPCSQLTVEEGSYLTNKLVLFSLLQVDAASDSLTCSQAAAMDPCVSLLRTARSFVGKYLGPYQRSSSAKMDNTLTALQAMNVSLFQFAIGANRSHHLLFANAFSMEPGAAFWAWTYLYQWATGSREVMTMVGDAVDSPIVSLLSTSIKNTAFVLNGAEIPHSLSLYFLRGIQYVTLVLACVATVVILVTVWCRGYVEPWNLLKLNRVGGIVWVGRPLLFLRSVSAIALLSTGVLQLEYDPIVRMTKFASPPPFSFDSFMRTVVVSGEVCWLSYVLDDIITVFTKQYTRRYAGKSAVLLWLVSAVLQLTTPRAVPPTLLRRKCQGVDLDFQIACTTGVVSIGNNAYFYRLIWLVGAITAMCYLLERCCRPTLPPSVTHSLLLYSLAMYTFPFERWRDGPDVYLDTASAFLNGLLVVPYARHVFVLDVKTWRVYRLTKSSSTNPRFSRALLLSNSVLSH